ncbi:hypothetical protein CJ030_MR1G003741 [Morella rubra]|uniref:Probable magnesium transporter n=1 Tax=Morella rubra TaxID=262757 RepID=A0A6A1WLY3_9ROSI|nr:hypothetical protein CJ030_MR1G003741 [Morella rubra]
MWESVCLTIVATAGNNIGKVLQKKGTLILPPLSFKFKARPRPYPAFSPLLFCLFSFAYHFCIPLVIRAYAFNKTWVIGFLMDMLGAMLMLRAISQAPVSVVQPVSGCGLAILSVFSHFYLKEVMNAIDWAGITLAAIGTIGVGAGGEEQEATTISIFHLPWLAFIVVILFVDLILSATKDNLKSVLLSVVCGGIFSAFSNLVLRYFLMDGFVSANTNEEIRRWISSVISKMGFIFLEQGFNQMLVPICIGISVALSGVGFYYQTRGLKHGRAIVVSTCCAVASIVTGVLAGMLALGERLPSAPTARVLLLLGWWLIITGVILLVSSAWLLRHLPAPLRHFIPTGVEKNFGGRRSGTVRGRETSPSAVIQAATLHHLISSPSKEKP